MKFLKWLLIVVIVLAAIFFIGGLFLPEEYKVERSIEINAPDSTVYTYVADFQNFKQWNPWSEREPDHKFTTSGTPGMTGHGYSWSGKEVGSGKMEITQAEPYHMIGESLIFLIFLTPWESHAVTNFFFQPSANGTKVTWTMEGKNTSTMTKWFGLMMDGMIGKDYEKGLANLKREIEKSK